MIDFCFDTVVDVEQKIVRPNLTSLPLIITKHELANVRGQLTTHFPYCDYPRMIEYARDHDVEFSISSVDSAPVGSFYFININQYIENFDYFSLLSDQVKKLVRDEKINILFQYCEADLPDRIDAELRSLCQKYNFNKSCVHFIIHNTRADQLENWYYFNDDEILYQQTCHQYLQDQILSWSGRRRSFKTTCLNRTHKNWRAVFAAQIYKNSLPNENILTYCANDQGDHSDLLDCPYKPELNKLYPLLVNDMNNSWLEDAQIFLTKIPITADNLDNATRNLYRTFVPDFFYNSYWNIIVETHIDIENHSGVFLTEKTWKPIAHLQPFVILGTPGSLAHLRDLGYQTFGDYLDESYDSCDNHVKRTAMVIDQVKWLTSRTYNQLHILHEKVQPTVEHNRRVFFSSKKKKLIELFNRLETSKIQPKLFAEY